MVIIHKIKYPADPSVLLAPMYTRHQQFSTPKGYKELEPTVNPQDPVPEKPGGSLTPIPAPNTREIPGNSPIQKRCKITGNEGYQKNKYPPNFAFPPDFRVSEDSRKILELREGERGERERERERERCVCVCVCRQVQKWWVSSSSKSSDG
jgi:hypothetical protein